MCGVQSGQCGDCAGLLTDRNLVPVPHHDVVGREVAVDDPLLLVQVPQRKAHLEVEAGYRNQQTAFHSH